MKVARNAPCPCGSGKKYKNCCLEGKSANARKGQNTFLGVAIAVVVLVALGAGAQWGIKSGVTFGLFGLVLIGIYLATRNPPSSRGRGGAGNINFGR